MAHDVRTDFYPASTVDTRLFSTSNILRHTSALSNYRERCPLTFASLIIIMGRLSVHDPCTRAMVGCQHQTSIVVLSGIAEEYFARILFFGFGCKGIEGHRISHERRGRNSANTTGGLYLFQGNIKYICSRNMTTSERAPSSSAIDSQEAVREEFIQRDHQAEKEACKWGRQALEGRTLHQCDGFPISMMRHISEHE
ncbi:uncharacterized protein LAESUDRAFT_710309 [Laetiporus sulphureus 93-53]|uniref:Uncharacterized protein n=1 Tax=Laetiporus sulphureus 93-53 TaxID=1314785 RepID=A0A165IMQ7_9APHY|nr:uncharacterized protein LAESUDRAFT_710309 [Laetiporus sulphureus 93-53]KZT13294.1 hypothetical protein LAESUDRAFT_710309 [Laetiporus sulphureus 93-53]